MNNGLHLNPSKSEAIAFYNPKSKPQGKSAGPTGVAAEVLKAAGETGTLWMTDVCNTVVKDGKVPEDWSRSWMVNVYKGKGDALICGS